MIGFLLSLIVAVVVVVVIVVAVVVVVLVFSALQSCLLAWSHSSTRMIECRKHG